MYKEVWQRAVSVSYCFAPAAAILLFVACYNSRPLVGCHDIHYEDLWCQRAECIAERRRRARGQNERGGAGRWPVVVELRHYTVQHTSSSTWAHGGALIHRWNAERSSLTRSQPRACVSARVWQLRVERRDEEGGKGAGILRKAKASKSTLLRRIWGVCVIIRHQRKECESK